MLTKDEILRKMNGCECPEYLVTPCWQPIYDQCMAAIDLAAENEQLKSKLDAVRELVGDIVWSTLGLPDYWANSIYIKSLKMLGIIDEDGDET